MQQQTAPENTFMLPVFRKHPASAIAVAGWVGLEMQHSDDHMVVPTLLYSDDCMFGLCMGTDKEALTVLSRIACNEAQRVYVNASHEPLTALEFYHSDALNGVPFAISFARQCDIDKMLNWKQTHEKFHMSAHEAAQRELQTMQSERFNTWMQSVKVGNALFANNENAQDIQKLTLEFPARVKFVVQMCVQSEQANSLNIFTDMRLPRANPISEIRSDASGVLVLHHPWCENQVYEMIDENGLVAIELEKPWTLNMVDDNGPKHNHNGICVQIYVPESVSTAKKEEFAVRQALAADNPSMVYNVSKIKTGVQPIGTQTYIEVEDILRGMQQQRGSVTDLAITGPSVQDPWTRNVFYRLVCVIPGGQDYSNTAKLLPQVISMKAMSKQVPLSDQCKVLTRESAKRTSTLTDIVRSLTLEQDLKLDNMVITPAALRVDSKASNVLPSPSEDVLSMSWIGAFNPALPKPTDEFRENFNIRGVGSSLDLPHVNKHIKLVGKHKKIEPYLFHTHLMAALYTLHLSKYNDFIRAAADVGNQLDNIRKYGTPEQIKNCLVAVITSAIAAAFLPGHQYGNDKSVLPQTLLYKDGKVVAVENEGRLALYNPKVVNAVANIGMGDEWNTQAYPLKINAIVSEGNAAEVRTDCEDDASQMIQAILFATFHVQDPDSIHNLRNSLHDMFKHDTYKNIKEEHKGPWVGLTVSFMRLAALAKKPTLGLVLAAGAQFDAYATTMQTLDMTQYASQTEKDHCEMKEMLRRDIANGHAVCTFFVNKYKPLKQMIAPTEQTLEEVDVSNMGFGEGTAAVCELKFEGNLNRRLAFEGEALSGVRECLKVPVNFGMVSSQEALAIQSKLETANIQLSPMEALSITQFVVNRVVVAIGGHIMMSTTHVPQDQLTSFYRYLIHVGDKLITCEKTDTHNIYSEIPSLKSAQEKKISVWRLNAKTTKEENAVLWARANTAVDSIESFDNIVAGKALPTLTADTLDAMASAQTNTMAMLVREQDHLQTNRSFKDNLDFMVANINQAFGGNSLLVTVKEFGHRNDNDTMYVVHLHQDRILEKFL